MMKKGFATRASPTFLLPGFLLLLLPSRLLLLLMQIGMQRLDIGLFDQPHTHRSRGNQA